MSPIGFGLVVNPAEPSVTVASFPCHENIRVHWDNPLTKRHVHNRVGIDHQPSWNLHDGCAVCLVIKRVWFSGMIRSTAEGIYVIIAESCMASIATRAW